MISTVDVLVIGAGPAGSVAASLISKAGLHVRVVEREKFPRFVIGESLLPRCMEVLEEAQLLEAVKAKNFQEKFGAKFLRGDEELGAAPQDESERPPQAKLAIAGLRAVHEGQRGSEFLPHAQSVGLPAT